MIDPGLADLIEEFRVAADDEEPRPSEADFETHTEERRRFAILNIPRNLFSEASGSAARRSSTSSLKNRMDR